MHVNCDVTITKMLKSFDLYQEQNSGKKNKKISEGQRFETTCSLFLVFEKTSKYIHFFYAAQNMKVECE